MAVDDGTPDDPSLGGYGGSGGYGGFTPLLSPVAQAMHMDPRFALAQAIMSTGQQQLQQPTYNMGSALAKALTMGIGGLTTVQLQNQYAGANAGDTAQHLADTLPENHPLRAALTSKDPVVRMYAMQGYGPAMGNLGKVLTVRPDQRVATGAGVLPQTASTVPLSEPGKVAVDAAAAATPEARTAIGNVLGKQGQDNGITYALGGGASVIPGGAGDANYQQRMALAKALGGGQGEAAYAQPIAAGKAAGTFKYDVARDRLKPDQIRENSETYFPPLPPDLQQFVTGPATQAPPRMPQLSAPPPPSAAVIAPSVAASGFAPPRGPDGAAAAAPSATPASDAPPAPAAPGPSQSPANPIAAGNSNLSVQPQPGGGVSVRNDGTVRTTTENNEKLFNEYRDISAANATAEKNIRNAADAFQHFTGGKGTELKAETAGWMKSVGLDPKILTSTDPAQVEIAKKAVIQSIFSQMAGVKNPALAEFAMLEKAVAQPDFQPESAKAILANALAKMHYQNDFAQEMGNYRQEHGTLRGYDSTPFLSNGLNLMNGYQDQAHQSLPQFMGEASAANKPETPPVDGARKAPDGNWYVADPARAGKYLMVKPHG